MQSLARRCCSAYLCLLKWRCRPHPLCQFDFHDIGSTGFGRRNLSSRFSGTVEHVTVPCGSNGSIQLHVNRYTASSSLPPPIIIYLPPGPVFSGVHTSSVTSILADNIAATVVQIDYRLGPDHRYPTPIHDVLFGFDWVLANLVGSQSGSSPGFLGPISPRLGVFGELTGGGLAAMLALTECHAKGYRVAAAAVNDPILDWVFPEVVAIEASGEATGNKRSKKNAKLAFWEDMQRDRVLQAMIKARPVLFRKPEDWFDSFASPTLFFRSAGVEVPKEHNMRTLDEFEELSLLNQKDFLREQLRLSAISNTVAGSPFTEESQRPAGDEAPKKPRKAAKRYPNVGSGLVLPNFLITTESSGMLYEQAAEFTDLICRSMVRTDELRHDDPELAVMNAQQRAAHMVRDPISTSRYWHQGWADGIAGVAQWFREVL